MTEQLKWLQVYGGGIEEQSGCLRAVPEWPSCSRFLVVTPPLNTTNYFCRCDFLIVCFSRFKKKQAETFAPQGTL